MTRFSQITFCIPYIKSTFFTVTRNTAQINFKFIIFDIILQFINLSCKYYTIPLNNTIIIKIINEKIIIIIIIHI